MALNSRRSYNVGTRRWYKFCEGFGVPHPLPAREGDLCLYVTFLSRSLKYDTIRGYLFGLRSHHIESGHADPLADTPLLHKMLRGIKKIQGQADKKPKFPVTLALLELIHPLIDPSSHDHLMLFASWCVAEAGLLRASEFTAFPGNGAPPLCNRNISEIKVDGGYVFRILHLEASKADPFRRGVDVILGHSASPANALNALASYNAARSAAALSPTAPLFAWKDGTPLSKEGCVRNLQVAISLLSMDTSRFSGFSFRRGGAQSLRDAGVPDHLIQAIGRWASDAYKVYLSTAPRHIAALAQRAAQFTKLPVCIAGPFWSPAL